MASKRNITYKCPFCDKRYNREGLVKHISNAHIDELPKDFTPLRYVFNYVNNKPITYHGRCTECGGDTPWDENKGRYDRQCGKKACHDSFVKKFEDNMVRTKGYKRISQTVEGQERMLARRKISGEYTFEDGVKKIYTGSYEKNALEFMDKVMHIKSSDVITPGPTFTYKFNGKEHLYISDIYYQPYNLIIEVKDGGKNPNKRSMPEYRGKQIAKEQYIIKHTNFNYLRLTDNDFSQLLSVFMDIKLQLVDNTGEKVVHINETMYALMGCPPAGIDSKGSVYVAPLRMQNNVFSGYNDRQEIAISDNPKFDHLITRDENGILNRVPNSLKLLENCTYNIFKISNVDPEVMNMIEKEIGNHVDKGFLYEALFDKKMYTFDQIVTESSAEPILDFYTYEKYHNKILGNYLLAEDTNKNYIESCIKIPEWLDESDYTFKINLLENKAMIQSKKIPELMIIEDSNDIYNCIDEYKVLKDVVGGK